MKKAKAYIESAVRYLFDLRRNKNFLSKLEPQHIPTFAFHFAKWKRPLLALWFPNRQFRYYPLNMAAFEQRKLLKFIQQLPKAEIMVWGRNYVSLFDKVTNKIWYLEDGFIRSVELGVMHSPPMSLTIDSQTPYFDSTQASDLETLLNEYPFDQDPELIEQAHSLINKMLKFGISKYNHVPNNKRSPYGIKTRNRVLIIGQVENDASIKYGCQFPVKNNDLIRLAARENPDAEIFYKPHPDVELDHRKKLSNPEEMQHVCQILKDDFSISQTLETIDHVYTITSLAGFEAVLRNIKVTTLGCPFYSGWGLTDDRQTITRRTRCLTKEQLFAGAMMLYPKYFNYQTNKEIRIDEAMDLMIMLKRQHHASE